MDNNDQNIDSRQDFEAKLFYKQIVHEEWTASRTIEAWRKWYDKMVIHTQPLTRAILDIAKLEPGLDVLDLASGTGEPAFSVSKYVAPDGHVIATDLSSEMLQVAEENAKRMGIGHTSFQQADAHFLPFDDESFDRVTCRAGIMYFWDCQRALTEIRRVLKPDGIAALVAWGPVEQSPFVTDFLGPFMMRKEMPKIPQDAPHPMRFGVPGSLSSELSRAGFRSVLEETRIEELPWPGPPDELWQHVYEIAVPMQPYFDSFSEVEREAAIHEVIANCSKHWDGKYTRSQGAINIASAIR